MKRIFWGMLLIMIDFGITNGAAFFDLLPDLLMFGTDRRSADSFASTQFIRWPT